MKGAIQPIVQPLVVWYQKNRRVLPWREAGTPYAIWISEIMLQQTRIEAVKKYYERFLREIPTITDLAKIDEEKLLKLWEGLGYYNRARNLQKAAIMMVEKYHGEMPKTYAELVQLPGIGEYTAGAIASIAYQEKVPAVDGNVLRVISRVTGSEKDILLPETKKEVTKVLQELMPEEAGDFNEGLMELGELICIPNGEPFCDDCPIQQFCVAKAKGLTGKLPIREKKIQRKQENRTVLLLTQQEKIAIRKREDSGLLAGMYEFPNVTGHLTEQEVKQILSQWGLTAKSVKPLTEATHVFSHIEWHMIGYHVEVATPSEKFLWVSKEALKTEYAIPTAFSVYKRLAMSKRMV